MNTIFRKLLITLLLCALPAMAAAAETAPADRPQTTAPAQPAPPAAPVPAENSSVTSKPQPPAALTPAKGGEPSASKPSIRIGHVDLTRVRTDSDPGKAGQALLTDKKKKLQTQIESKRKQLDKLRAAIEAKLSTYNPLQKEVKAKEFQKKVEEYQRFLQNADNELQELQQEQSRLLYEKIEQASAEYGKANGLAVVVIKGDLLYQADGVDMLDVTAGIVKLVNEQANKK